MVSDDFPDPETPVTTTSLFLGMDTLMFLRLWTLAPLIVIFSAEFTVFVFAGIFPFIVFSINVTAKVNPYGASFCRETLNISLAANNTQPVDNCLAF